MHEVSYHSRGKISYLFRPPTAITLWAWGKVYICGLWEEDKLLRGFVIMLSKQIFFFILYSLKGFSQIDSITSRKINFRVGIGIFAMPGIYAEKNLSKVVTAEAGILSYLIISEASIGLKYHVAGKNNFKIKAGIGCGMAANIATEKSNPYKSGPSIYILPSIPIEFIYKSFSLELQQGYPINIAGDDRAKIPIIVFLSYIIPR
jgi:hypothetical protein